MRPTGLIRALGLVIAFAASASGTVFINEFNHNPPGSLDDFREFIELCGTPGKKLDGYAIAFLNGTQEKFYARNTIPPLPSPNPEIDEFFSLDGLQLGANGLLVIAISGQFDYPEALSDTTFVDFWVDLWNGGLDVPNRLQNDGSTTVMLVRNRPGRTEADPANPGGLRWGKGIFNDFNLIRNVTDPQTNTQKDQFGDGGIDQGEPNGLSGTNLDLRGSKTPLDVLDDLEIVDEVSYEHDRGWEYDIDDRKVDVGSNNNGLPDRRVHALDDPQGFNPDALTRVDYRTKGPGWTPIGGGAGQMANGNNWQDTATEQWIRGESVAVINGEAFEIYYDNSPNLDASSIQPFLTNVPRWLANGVAPDYVFGEFAYRVMAGRVNPLAVPFIPGDVDRDGDCDADDIQKLRLVFGDDDWVFSNSYGSAPEGDDGNPATQTRPWDVDQSGDNGIEASDLQWTLNFQGDTTGRVVGVRYDSTTPSAPGVHLSTNAGVQCAVTAAANIPTGRTLTTLHVNDVFDVIVSARVASGAKLSPANQTNGVMQFIHDVLLSSPGVVRVESVEAIAPYTITRQVLLAYPGTVGDLGVHVVNGFTTSFGAGLAQPAELYRVRMRAVTEGSTQLTVRRAESEKFALSTPHGLKVGRTSQNGNPAGATYPSPLTITVVPSVVLPGNCDADPVVTHSDYACMSECVTGPGVPHAVDCELFDLDQDGDVDLADFKAFELMFSVN